MRKLLMLVALCLPMFAQTAINDTLYLQDSTPWTGVITVSWPAFTNCPGTAIGAGSRDYAVTNGVVSITLYATDCASPSFSYGARYRTSVGTNRGVTWSEAWAIPSTPSIVTLRAVRQSSTFTIQPGQIMSGGATSGQCLAWSGTAWAPAACGTGGGGAVSSVAGRTGDVVLAQSDIAGLVSALAGKASSSAATTVNGQSCALGSTCTVADSTKEPALGNPGSNGYVLSSTTGGVRSWVAQSAGGGGTWGSITGTLSSQSDLNTALAGKAASNANTTVAGQTCALGSTCAVAVNNLTAGAVPAGTTISIPQWQEYLAAVCQGALPSISFSLPSANAPTALCKAGSNTNLGVAQFTATGQSLQGSMVLPDDWVSLLAVELRFFSESAASTGNVVWSFQYACSASSYDPSLAAAQTVTIAAGANNALATATLTPTISGCSAGQRMFYKLALDGTTTASGSEDLIAIRFKVKRTVTAL